MKKRILAAAMTLAMSLSILSACGGGSTNSETTNSDASSSEAATDAVADSDASPDSSADSQSTTKSGEGLSLTVYSSVLEDYMIEALKLFSEETGVDAQGVRLGVGETLGRLRAEKENPQASVWFGGAAETFLAAQNDGLLEPYISPNAKDIPDKYKDAEGYWTGFYVGYLGFASNKRLLEEKGLEVPTSWDDLLVPELEGQVSLANPAASGTSYNMLATLVMSMGEQEAIDYMVKLDKNVKQYEKSGTAPARLVGQGEAIVGITFMHDSLKYWEEGLSDLVVSAPDSGTGYEIGSIAIVKGGPDQEAAKMFVDWLLDNAELGQKYGSYQFMTNPNLTQPEIAMPYFDTKLIDFDLEYAADNRDRLVEEWANAVGQ